jgi:hypothetical protein
MGGILMSDKTGQNRTSGRRGSPDKNPDKRVLSPFRGSPIVRVFGAPGLAAPQNAASIAGVA